MLGAYTRLHTSPTTTRVSTPHCFVPPPAGCPTVPSALGRFVFFEGRNVAGFDLTCEAVGTAAVQDIAARCALSIAGCRSFTLHVDVSTRTRIACYKSAGVRELGLRASWSAAGGSWDPHAPCQGTYLGTDAEW